MFFQRFYPLKTVFSNNICFEANDERNFVLILVLKTPSFPDKILKNATEFKRCNIFLKK